MLGVGGAGIVYEILHKTNGSRFALKEMEVWTHTGLFLNVLYG